eukprot:TRINITY_DN4503_c0_g4_i1.p2 TRINITY_DN4503_c0_g4~~TRINITY_DN4503_c0_g4_i1.p2  ORF type:complete len:120 (-),score=26.41 TRINITY_DN4503_c0_g4_i1:965-1324(-)
MIYDCSQQKEWHKETFNFPVLRVLIVKDRLIAVLATEVYVLNIDQEFAVIKHVRTCRNDKGACSINSTNDMTVLITLTKTEGELMVYNDFLKTASKITAFATGIQDVALNLDVINSKHK